MASQPTLVCKCCGKEKPVRCFSEHSSTLSGYDTSRCKRCKSEKTKGARDWASTPLERKMLNRAKGRAKAHSLPFDITEEDITIPDVCPVFGTPFVYGDHYLTASIDRIVPELGYVRGNIVVISNKANMLKGAGTVEEIYKLADWLRRTVKDLEVS